MKRKLLLSVVIAIISVLTPAIADAQVVTIGGSASYWRNYKDDHTTFSIAFDANHGLSERWLIGLNAGFKLNREEGVSAHALTLNPYLRYVYFTHGILSLYMDGTVGFANEHIKGRSGNAFGLEVGLKPGISVRITDRAWFAAGLGFIGYRHSKYAESALGDRGFGVDFSSTALSFGFYYAF